MVKNKQTSPLNYSHLLSGTAAGVLMVFIGLVGMLQAAAATYQYVAPTVTAATTSSAYAIQVTWKDSGNKNSSFTGTTHYPDGFEVKWTNTAGGSGSKYYSGYAPGTVYKNTYTNLNCSAKYTYSAYLMNHTSTGNTQISNVGTSTAVTPACGKVTLNAPTVSGDKVTLSWTSNFASSYTVATTPAVSGYSGTAVTSPSSFTGACNTTYSSITITGKDGSGHSVTSTAQKASTANDCPPPPSTGGGTSTSSGSTSTPKTTTPKVTTAAPQPPSVPSNFMASLQASKIVELSWNPSVASAGIKQYELSRSTDQQLWNSLAISSDTSYEDSDTDFSHTYYYRVRAIDNNGAASDYASVHIDTEAFKGDSSSIKSDDNLVSVQMADGTFSQPTDCTVTVSDQAIPQGTKQVILLGPYVLSCVGQDGSVVTDFGQEATVTMDLSKASSGYTNIGIQTVSDDGSTWSHTDGHFDPKTKKLTFKLTAAKTFASFGQKKSNPFGAIFGSLLLLSLIGGGVFLIQRRRKADGSLSPAAAAAMLAPAAATSPAATDEAKEAFEQAVNKPNCTHLGMATPNVQPQTDGCQECLAAKTQWKALRICLVCGHVGCSDDSYAHARKHYEETGHPLMMAYGDPNAGNIGWCYIDETYI